MAKIDLGDLGEWGKESLDDTLTKVNEGGLELASRIENSTPVLDSHLKRNWKLTGNLTKGIPLLYINDSPYGPRIEYEGHSSIKAPAGMVRINTINWKSILEDAFK